MGYFMGISLAIAVGAFLTASGIDRDRSVYPVILLVIASYYALFAVMGDSAALSRELAIFFGFGLAATIGFKTNLWMVVVALAGHGLLDWYHHGLVENEGVPTWWAMFCLSFDGAAGAYLAGRLVSRKINASDPLTFGTRIKVDVDAELAAARLAELGGDPCAAFQHLERAHILGQRSTVHHVRVHWHMLMWSIRRQSFREVVGQTFRVSAAAGVTWAGLVPHGNTGGADVSPFRPMNIPPDLRAAIESARFPNQCAPVRL
ncbi:DUF3703 domain-containing protein [Tsuneonella sp. HG249]